MFSRFAVAVGRAVEVRAAAMRAVEDVPAGTVDDPLVGRHRRRVEVDHAGFVDGDFHRAAGKRLFDGGGADGDV